MIPFPNKKYSVIYADPPWAYQQGGLGLYIQNRSLCVGETK